MKRKTNHAETIDRMIQHYETMCTWLELQMRLEAAMRLAHHPRTTHPDFQYIFECAFNGPGSNWRTFRQHLLNVHTKGFDYRKYTGAYMNEINPRFGVENYYEYMIAAWVASWSKSSRRIYSVPGDLQLLLAATSLEGADWSAVNWPFDSFLVTLEHPLMIDDSPYDSILVCDSMQNDPAMSQMITIVVTGKKLYTQESVFQKGQAERILRAIDSNNFLYAEEKLVSIVKNKMSNWQHFRIIHIRKSCFTEADLIKEIERSSLEHALSKTAIRILFGLLFYLQSAPAEETQPKGWERNLYIRPSQAVKKITLASEVCEIASKFTLSHAEREEFKNVLSGGRSDISPHHREGHWRRPPGKGNDPTAKKSVWVRPTIVRLDKIADGGLPGGSEKIII